MNRRTASTHKGQTILVAWSEAGQLAASGLKETGCALVFTQIAMPGDLPGGALGYVDGRAFLGIAATSAIAAPLGAATVHRLSPKVVKRFFGLFLMLVGARMLTGF